LPNLVLWAWDRPEDLRGLGDRIGVAFLAASVDLRGADTEIRLRRPPLTVDPETALIAVIRIETDRRRTARLNEAQRIRIAQLFAQVVALPQVRAAQVDFDAVRSERAFYRALLHDVREALPEGIPLSITALTSWCMEDVWLAGVPVDEAVPMAFRTASSADAGIKRVAAAGSFTSPLCRGSLGTSTDEPLPFIARRERVYVFHPRAWSFSAMAAVAEEASTWR
jgi:hypothetical protein